MIDFKKVLSVAKENNLFSKNEAILIAGSSFFILATVLFSTTLRIDYQAMSYISSVGIVHVLILNIIGAYFAISSINKDISGKYIYFILKSVSRTEYILGKALSIFWILFLINIIFTVVFFAFYIFMVGKVDFAVLYAPIFQFLEAWVFSMFALMLSLFIKNNAGRIFALIAVYFTANSTFSIHTMIKQGAFHFGDIGDKLFNILYVLFPNFNQFNVRDVLPYNTSLAPMLGSSTLYALIFVTILILGSIWAFRKDNL